MSNDMQRLPLEAGDLDQMQGALQAQTSCLLRFRDQVHANPAHYTRLSSQLQLRDVLRRMRDLCDMHLTLANANVAKLQEHNSTRRSGNG